MKNIKTLVLVGGISRDSLNKKLYNAIQEMEINAFDFESFDISRLPFFSQDLENDPPDMVTEFKEKIRHCDAVLLISPEYNRSIPGVLKNAIDWGSRPYGQNLWEKKPAAVMGASVGNIGTFGAQHHLRQVTSYLDMYTMNQPEFYFNGSKSFDSTGKLTNDKTKELLEKFFESFEEHVALITGQDDYGTKYKTRGGDDSSVSREISH